MKPRENMTEAEFKNVVISIAKRYGWLIHHDLPAQNARGKWATHIQGDAGFPDLLMVHPVSGKILAVELKAEKGKLSPLQKRWLMAFDVSATFQNRLVARPKPFARQLVTLGNEGRSARSESCETK